MNERSEILRSLALWLPGPRPRNGASAAEMRRFGCGDRRAPMIPATALSLLETAARNPID